MSFRYLRIIFLFFFPVILFGQVNIDSLEQLISKVDIENRASIYNELSDAYRRFDQEKALGYGNIALNLSDEYNLKSDKVIALNNIGFAWFHKSNLDSALYFFYAAYHFSKLNEDLKGLSNSLKNIGNVRLSWGDLKLALAYYDSALTIKKEINDIKGIMILNNNKGVAYYNIGEHAKSLESLEDAHKASIELGEKDNVIMTLNNLGNTYHSLGSYEKAIEYNFRALKLAEELGDKLSISNSYSNLGSNYDFWGNHEKSLEYHEKSLKIARELNDLESIAVTLNNIGNLYITWENYNKAIEYYEESLNFKYKIGRKKGVAISLNNIGECYYKLERYEAAIAKLKEAIKINQEIGANSSLSSNYLNLGSIYTKLKQFANAEEYLKKSLSLASNVDVGDLNEIYFELSELYKARGLFKKALEYYHLYNVEKDSIFNKEKALSISEMRTKYETEKQQQEIEILSKDKKLQNTEIKKQTLIRNSFIFGFLFVLCVAGLLFILYNTIRKNNQQLTIQNAEILQKNEEINAQAEHLEVANEELERLSIVASKTDNAVLIADVEGNVEWINEGFTRLYGKTLGELVLQYGPNLVHVSNSLEIKTILKQTISQRNTSIFETKSTNSNGQSLYVQTTLTPVVDEKGELVKLVAIDTDITLTKEAEFKIQHQHDELQKLNATKDKLMAVIGHDLKNPFNSMLGITELLLDSDHDMTKIELIQAYKAIYGSAQSGFNLLTNLLDWARSQAGTIKFEPEKYLILDLVNFSIDNVEIMADIKNIKFDVEVPRNIVVFTDKNIATTVLRNLISNAIKFSYEGKKITVAAIEKSDVIEVKVMDEGTGISNDFMSNLFTTKSGQSTPGTSSEKGTGIGLLLCKEFVDKWGGRIWAESEPEKGSSFNFTFPKIS